MKKPPVKTIALFVLFALASSRAPGDILAPGMSAKDSVSQIDSLETRNGFSAQFWMTTDDQIFSAWEKTGAIRNLKSTLQVRRNTSIYLALFLANPGVRSVVKAQGAKPILSSDVTFDLYIISPGGVLSLANKQRSGWKGPPPSPGLVYLAKDRGVLNFEVIDPLGEYTVVLVVHDNIRKADLKLVRKLQLLE